MEHSLPKIKDLVAALPCRCCLALPQAPGIADAQASRQNLPPQYRARNNSNFRVNDDTRHLLCVKPL